MLRGLTAIVGSHLACSTTHMICLLQMPRHNSCADFTAERQLSCCASASTADSNIARVGGAAGMMMQV